MEKKFEVKLDRKKVLIPQSQYMEDNLIYHSLVHTLEVAADKIDYLQKRGYMFHNLKSKMKAFESEITKHVGGQMSIMTELGNSAFWNHTQKDFDFIHDFLARANPAKITYLANLIRTDAEIDEMNDVRLRELLESGKIEVEPERKGRSEYNYCTGYRPTPIRLKGELENGMPVYNYLREHRHIPERNDIVFWEGRNYKVLYRKFIYSVGNGDLDTVVLKLEEINKKF